MGYRKVVIRQSAAESIAEISWYLESEGLLATAEKFTDDAYDFITKISDRRKGYRICQEPMTTPALLAFARISTARYKKKSLREGGFFPGNKETLDTIHITDTDLDMSFTLNTGTGISRGAL